MLCYCLLRKVVHLAGFEAVTVVSTNVSEALAASIIRTITGW